MSVYKLVPGVEKKERIELILQMTKIRSEAVKEAVYRVLVNGWSEEMAAYNAGIDKKAVYRALDRLNHMAELVEKVKEFDWKHRNE